MWTEILKCSGEFHIFIYLCNLNETSTAEKLHVSKLYQVTILSNEKVLPILIYSQPPTLNGIKTKPAPKTLYVKHQTNLHINLGDMNLAPGGPKFLLWGRRAKNQKNVLYWKSLKKWISKIRCFIFWTTHTLSLSCWFFELVWY